MKKCTQCGEVKPLSEFHKRKTGSKDGHRGECKYCRHFQYAADAFHKKAKEFYSSRPECTIDLPDGELKVLHGIGILEPMEEPRVYSVPLWMTVVETIVFSFLAGVAAYLFLDQFPN